LGKAANDSIRYETAKVTALSAAAGIPGGLALFASVPADFAQTLAHILRIAQKLAYLYSWPDLFESDSDEKDDATSNLLTLFLGVMFSTQMATEGVAKAAEMIAKQVAKELPKQALIKGVIYPRVKSVAKRLGVEMTKQVFAKGVANVTPVAGAVISGGVTIATFVPMSRRPKKHLAVWELARPRGSDSTSEVATAP
jgi:hypothetical protein